MYVHVSMYTTKSLVIITLPTGKSAKASSVFPTDESLTADKAVDGIYLPPPALNDRLSLAHTDASNSKPWLRVDIGRVHCIWGIRILNRAGKYTY